MIIFYLEKHYCFGLDNMFELCAVCVFSLLLCMILEHNVGGFSEKILGRKRTCENSIDPFYLTQIKEFK